VKRKKFTTAPFPKIDENKPKKRGALWCCYCGDWMKFQSKGGGYPRCIGCDISDEDWYIKTANGLWEGIKVKSRK
jgi:hypothetical protein